MKNNLLPSFHRFLFLGLPPTVKKLKEDKMDYDFNQGKGNSPDTGSLLFWAHRDRCRSQVLYASSYDSQNITLMWIALNVSPPNFQSLAGARKHFYLGIEEFFLVQGLLFLGLHPSFNKSGNRNLDASGYERFCAAVWVCICPIRST